MERTEARAEFAEAEVASLLDRAAYHKRQVWKHRKQLNECMAEAQRLRAMHERLSIEHVVVPSSSQPGGTEHEHHDHPGA